MKKRIQHRLQCGLWYIAPIVLALCGAVSGANAQTKPSSHSISNQSSTKSAGASIVGFRGANFGMSEQEIRDIIKTHFGIPSKAITQSADPVQRTEALTTEVPNLIHGGGTAAISYIFGYSTHGLIEINVVWSKATDSKITAAMLYQNGESLQQYFAGEGFSPARSVGNVATSDGILLFRTMDTNGNAVLLTLSGVVTKDTKGNKATLSPDALTLVYAANPLHPDVFHLAKGSF